ncbi:hypothetical protein [Archangium primigenium]|uniref:hypothetical protein n=1 Tax=[Archangium] primigenium TaxID=2792470 RepID=UPI0019584190|nr:hypothetical protein [Archangium primigenium]MBM7119217.1 hypothetical protein [Archangium primigenium]
MRTLIKSAAWVFIWVLGSGMAAPGQEDAWLQPLPQAVHEACGGPVPGLSTCGLLDSERRPVAEGIAEYTYTLQVGAGAYDKVVMHRVVQEESPGVPRTPERALFLLHGDIWGFRGAFLSGVAGGSRPGKPSFAVYLAQQGLDVWGLDMRWVNVPAQTTDFTFMRNWNLEMHARDLGTGLAVARYARGLSSARAGGPLPLLGWSRGAMVGYAYLNEETQAPPDRRHVSAFIPVDMAFSFGPDAAAQRQDACQGYKMLASLQVSGMYVDGSGQTLQDLGAFANVAPALPSSLLPGFTNRQAALLAGAATWRLQGLPIFKWYHFTGGVFSGATPTSLSWTQERFFFDTLEQAAPYQSIGEQVESLALWCGAPKLPYNDRLKQVKVPVLYVGAEGGTGRYGLHSVSLLGSKDVSSFLVQRLRDGSNAQDYGHADLFLATDADRDVWPRITDWLARH